MENFHGRPIPVSYTHLDVYKRQTYVIPLLFFKRVSDTYDEETQLAIEEYGDDVHQLVLNRLGKSFRNSAFLEPVSYTHLDVYKRQEEQCSR